MRSLARFAVCLLLAAACVAQSQPAAQPANKAQASVADLKWLSGCWGSRMKGGQFEECWNTPAGREMHGNARVVTESGDTVFREVMQIEQLPEGVVMTVQHVGSKLAPDSQPVSFLLVSLTDTEAVFENPRHDHPQRIRYIRQKNGGIVARIENLDGSRSKDFPMDPLPQSRR